MASTVKARTTGKINSIAKILFTVPTTKNLNLQINLIEDLKSSYYYDMEVVEFLVQINFDNGHFDDNSIDYIAECI